MARVLAIFFSFLILSCLVGERQAQATDLVCLTCHSAPSFSKVNANGSETSLRVDQETLKSSAHARLNCLDCHTDFRGRPIPHGPTAQPVQCARCHHNGNHQGAPDTSHIEKYADSVHGSALKNGDPDAPKCKTCHGTHDIRPPSDPKSRVYRGNIPATCGTCHFNAGFAKRHKIMSVKGYKDSVHARVAMRGNGFDAAAVCIDCHGVHDITAPGSIDSPVSKMRVPATCGRCHPKVQDEYLESIHGRAVARGVKAAPVCTDCHGEHNIKPPSEAASPVYPTHVVTTCSKCHENAGIQRKFGLPGDRLSSYMSSYHGVANKYGDVTVANCATCHGAHRILPSSDPRSAINKKNLPHTCGKCHPGAGQNFATGSIHVVPTPKHDAIVYWVRSFYMLFVAGLIGSFCGYILLDLRARWVGRLPWRRGDHDR